MTAFCKNNDLYDISRNECAIFRSAGDYLQHKYTVHNNISRSEHRVFHSNKDRIRDTYQINNTQRTVTKGRNGATYPMTMLLNNGSSNECRRMILPQIDALKIAGYYLRRGYVERQS